MRFTFLTRMLALPVLCGWLILCGVALPAAKAGGTAPPRAHQLHSQRSPSLSGLSQIANPHPVFGQMAPPEDSGEDQNEAPTTKRRGYFLEYVLVGLLFVMTLFAVCRPSRRN